MNVSSRLETVTVLPPCRPAPLSATKRCSSAVASGLVPRNVRESRRVAPVTASGSDVVCSRHTPGDRSVIEPVLGFTTHHADDSHPNRARRGDRLSRRCKAFR
jgi:hypothetical protein